MLVYTWWLKQSLLSSVFLCKIHIGIFFDMPKWEILANPFVLTLQGPYPPFNMVIMQLWFFWDKTELSENLNKTSTDWMIFCVSALTCISYLQTFVQPQSVLLNETFLLSFWRCSGFMFLSHPHFWPNSWKPYLFFSCQSRPNLSAKMKHTGITQHCLFSYIFSQDWVVCVLFCGWFFFFPFSIWVLQRGFQKNIPNNIN